MTNAQEHIKAETLNQNLGHLWRVVPASEHTVGPAEAPVGDRTTTQRPPPHCPRTGAGPQSMREQGLAAHLQGSLPPGAQGGPLCLLGLVQRSAPRQPAGGPQPCCGSPGCGSDHPRPPHHACGR